MSEHPVDVWTHRVARYLERAIDWGVRHWLLFVNLAFLFYVVFAVLAPVFMHLGWERLGKGLYLAYRPFCHQLPERSFFLFGQKWAYTLNELYSHGLSPTSSMWQRRLYVGSPEVGYKMAFCQRDLAIYGTFALGGMIYGATRRYWRPLPWRWYLLSLAPLALDGLTQLFGMRVSSPLLRVITGSLSAWTTIWALYPRVDESLLRALNTDEGSRVGTDSAPLHKAK